MSCRRNCLIMPTWLKSAKPFTKELTHPSHQRGLCPSRLLTMNGSSTWTRKVLGRTTSTKRQRKLNGSHREKVGVLLRPRPALIHITQAALRVTVPQWWVFWFLYTYLYSLYYLVFHTKLFWTTAWGVLLLEHKVERKWYHAPTNVT